MRSSRVVLLVPVGARALLLLVQGGSGALVVGPTAGWTGAAPFYEEPFADHWFEKSLEP